MLEFRWTIFSNPDAYIYTRTETQNYCLRLSENTRNALDKALKQLRKRYSRPDQRRNFELHLQSRKSEPAKEQPDFLNDIQRLANLAIADNGCAAIDHDEKTRRN